MELTDKLIQTALNDKPDFILRTAHAMPDTVNEMFKKEFENNKSWSHFEAVKNNKVIDLDSSIFGMTATFDYQKGLEELSAFLKKEKYNVQNIKDLKESMYIHNNGFLTAADRRYCTCKKERCRLWWCKYRRKNYFCCTKEEK